MGLCVPNDSTACAPYVCNDAGNNCLADCAVDGVNDCAVDFLCSQEDACVESFDNGNPCAAGQCTSGFCVDGVCCDGACDGTCEQCFETVSGLPDGTCGFAPAFTDPKDMCVDPIGCNETGSCATCGFSPAAPGGAACPPECDTCSMAAPWVCNILCNDAAPLTDCTGQAITCPPGWDCNVRCITADACANASVACPADHACRVACEDVMLGCQNLAVNCSENGPCVVDCKGGNTCQGAVLECQNNACGALCDGAVNPGFTDNASACRLGCQ